MRSYEIHTFQKGRWKIDSIFDDRELALFEAQRMDESARYSGVRVVEEAFDDNNTKTRARTIFRGTKAAQSNKKALKAKSLARQEVAIERRRKAARDAERRRAQQRKARKDEANPYRLLSILMFLVALAFGVLYGLEQLHKGF